ncbi:MAG: peroxide stress protein YaaA [Acidimicrobiales bacterium]|nr:peroxide stress protein YaaA [Acidimicrobiales bacterium]
MLIVVSPAKSLDLESKLPTRKHSDHRLLDQSVELVEVMAKKSPDDLQALMSISPELAELNFERFQDWSPPFTTRNARPALLMFNGDTYLGMDAPNTFGERDYTRAQKVLRILSGLYGVLRPLDLIQPYRLEMGSKVSNPRGRDLYDYWGEIPTRAIAEDLDASPGGRFLVNLASNEYFRAVRPELLDAPVITPRFLDHGPKAGSEPKVISFFAKRARGAMAGWIVRERIGTRSALSRFDGLGYRYDADRSTRDEPTFVR